jgi:hypothetical protein
LQDVRSGKPGTLEQLSLPAGGDYSAMMIEERAPEEEREELARTVNVVSVVS